MTRSTVLLSLLVWTAPVWANSYTSTFSATENPLSESGAWLNPSSANVQLANVQSTGGNAYGTQDPATQFDSVALLAGTWTTAQTVEATVVVNVAGSGREVWLGLNGTITPGSPGNVTLYEADFIISGILVIARWNDIATQDYTILLSSTALPGGALVTGDVVKFTNDGAGVLTVYVNGTQVAQVTDTVLTGGHPGIGFFDSFGYGGALTDQGFSSVNIFDNAGSGPLLTPMYRRRFN